MGGLDCAGTSAVVGTSLVNNWQQKYTLAGMVDSVAISLGSKLCTHETVPAIDLYVYFSYHNLIEIHISVEIETLRKARPRNGKETHTCLEKIHQKDILHEFHMAS